MKKFDDYLESARSWVESAENEKESIDEVNLFGQEVHLVLNVESIVQTVFVLTLLGVSGAAALGLWIKEKYAKAKASFSFSKAMKEVEDDVAKYNSNPDGKKLTEIIGSLNTEQKRELKSKIELKIKDAQTFKDVVDAINKEVKGFKNIKTQNK